MKQLNYGRKKIVIPESWEECSAEQFTAAVAILHRPELQGAIEEVPVVIFDRLLHALSGLSLYRYWMLPADMRQRCFEHIFWALMPAKITSQLIPVYKKHWGPASDFNNLVLSEFHHTEIAFANYAGNNQDEAALNELVAILYRRPKKRYNKHINPEGDVRVAFNYAEVQYNIKRIARWPPAVKQAIALWYGSCKQALIDAYADAFKGSSKGSAHDVQGMYKIIRSMAGDKYGTFDKVENLTVHLAFMEIAEARKEYEALKLKYPDLYKD